MLLLALGAVMAGARSGAGIAQWAAAAQRLFAHQPAAVHRILTAA